MDTYTVWVKFDGDNNWTEIGLNLSEEKAHSLIVTWSRGIPEAVYAMGVTGYRPTTEEVLGSL
jgi:hypothetical protein